MDVSGREPEPRSWTARVLVWTALGVVVALVYLILSGEIGGIGEDSGDGKRTAVSEEDECNPPADNALKLGYYILKPGEPGLSQVAVRTCMTEEELSRLNPEINPQAIPAGQCINLRRDGCEAR